MMVGFCLNEDNERTHDGFALNFKIRIPRSQNLTSRLSIAHEPEAIVLEFDAGKMGFKTRL
jgi:hypothetical protein